VNLNTAGAMNPSKRGRRERTAVRSGRGIHLINLVSDASLQVKMLRMCCLMTMLEML